jgi:hypothetical protein
MKKAYIGTFDGLSKRYLDVIQRQAAAVEELLYRKHLRQPHLCSDDPFVVCSDVNDNERVNEILSRQLAIMQGHFAKLCNKRREEQTRKAHIQDGDFREQTLQQCLGVDGYRRANIVLKAIDQIGVELTGECARCDNRMKLAKGSIPEPVRQLFCQTSLRTLMYFTPVSYLHTIAWEESLSKAERSLQMYNEWSRKCKDKCIVDTGNISLDVLNKVDLI